MFSKSYLYVETFEGIKCDNGAAKVAFFWLFSSKRETKPIAEGVASTRMKIHVKNDLFTWA